DRVLSTGKLSQAISHASGVGEHFADKAALIARLHALLQEQPIVNDTVPRFLHDGKWAPKATQATLSNAMDVSQPNNWPRVEELF
ncbi:hypothetical protein MJM95_27300, partial [Salmonella enterica subsp. enterica serovar Anatum]|nr:hypothetical protein [Salmonella enterica subsp. enterica serovar Anatum]